MVPKQRSLREELKLQYFITDNCNYGRRPNPQKVECEGNMTLSLCSKSYFVNEDGTKFINYSAKRVQKANFSRCPDQERSRTLIFGETFIGTYCNLQLVTVVCQQLVKQ